MDHPQSGADEPAKQLAKDAGPPRSPACFYSRYAEHKHRTPSSRLPSDPVREKRLTPARRGRSAPRQVHPVVGGAVDGGVPDEGQPLCTAVRHLRAVGKLLPSRARVLPVGDLWRGATDCGIKGIDKKKKKKSMIIIFR